MPQRQHTIYLQLTVPRRLAVTSRPLLMTDDTPEATYGIGAVARLTGIRLESLRAWERRYRVVIPRRTDTNQRLYTREDVARLQLIKQLVDRGHAVSTVASLSEQALRDRLQPHLATVSAPLPVQRPIPVMIYGDVLPFLVESWRGDLALDVLGTYVRFADFERAALERRPEVLVLELPALNPDMLGRIRDLQAHSGARRMVVVYGFGTQSVIGRLQHEAIVTLRSPVTARELEHACHVDAEHAAALRSLPAEVQTFTEEIPLRRFNGEQLAAVATTASGIRCECPHHLADLVVRINAFEAYSADCEDRNEQDAALHAQLHRTAAKARVLLEEALEALIQYEEIDLAAPH